MTTDPCLSFREQLSAWIDGDLSPEASRKVSAHLEVCASCSRDLELLRTAIGALQRFPVPPEPTDILAGLRKRLAPEPWYRRLLRPKGEVWGFGIPVGALATFLVIVGVAFFQAQFPGDDHKHATPSYFRTREKEPYSSKNPEDGMPPVRYPGEKAITLEEPSPAPSPARDSGSSSLTTKPKLMVLSLLVRNESDLDDLRKAIEGRGGIMLESGPLDEQALRGIVSSAAPPVPDAGNIRVGWKLVVRLPLSSLAPLVEEIGRRPGHQFLKSKSEGTTTGMPPSKQDVLIFVFLR